MLTTLAAVFGGKGTIFGTFIGVLIIGSLKSGIIALGLSGFYIQFINGLMITSAVTIFF
jgi:simple sugar transport system permease protein